MDTLQSLIVISIVVGTCQGELDCSLQNIWITKAKYSVVDPNMGCETQNGVCEQTVRPEDIQYVYNHCMAGQTNMITCTVQSGKNVTAEAECVKGNMWDPCLNSTYHPAGAAIMGRILSAGLGPYYCECILDSSTPQDFHFVALNFFPFHDKGNKRLLLKVRSTATGAYFEEQFQLFPRLHNITNVSRLGIWFARHEAGFPARQILSIKANQGFKLQCSKRDPPPDSTHAEGNESSTVLITTLIIGGLVVVAVIVGILYWRRRKRDRGTQSALDTSTLDRGNAANPVSARTGQGRKNNAPGAFLCFELAGPLQGSPTSVYSAARHVEDSATYSCAKGTESEVYDSLQSKPIKQVIIDNTYSHCSAPNVSKIK